MMDFEHEILTKEEVYELFEKFHNGDLLAREKLILSNLKLAFKISLTFHHDEDSYLKSLAIEGLIKAVDNYDLSSKLAFSTYAYPCIKNILISDYNRFQKRIKSDIYFETATDYFMNDSNIRINIEDDILDKIEISEILKKLDQLPEDEKSLVKQYFGIDCDRKTNKELAKELSIQKFGVDRRVKIFIKKLI